MAGVINVSSVDTFRDKYVRKGVLTTYHKYSGDVFVWYDEKACVDQDPKSNIYQHICRHTGLQEALISEDSKIDPNEYSVNSDECVTIYSLNKESVHDDVCGTDFPEDIMNVISTREDNLWILPCQESVDGGIIEHTFENILHKLKQFKKYINPIMCVQYLTILLDYFQVGSVIAINSNEELEKFMEKTYESANEVPHSTAKDYSFAFYSTSLTDRDGFEEIKKQVRPHCPDDILIIHEGKAGSENTGMFLIQLNTHKHEDIYGKHEDMYDKNNKEGEEKVDGELCSVILQLSIKILTSLVVYAIKQIRKYIKKHNKKSQNGKKRKISKTEIISEVEEDKEEEGEKKIKLELVNNSLEMSVD